MKALSLTQPWATLVAIGAKKIETRSWTTNYRGPLAIHAAKNFPESAQRLCAEDPFMISVLRNLPSPIGIASMPTGCIIATCELIGVDRFESWINERNPVRWAKGKYYFELTDQEWAFGDYSIGRYGFFLANIKMLPAPIPARGSLGLWNWDERQLDG